MPVQINEMVIRANITDSVENEKQPKKTITNNIEAADIDKSEIIKECAEMVLEIINRKNQR